MDPGFTQVKKYPLLFCPLGLLLAVFAHLVLCCAAVALAISGHPLYWCHAFCYAILGGLLLRNYLKRRATKMRRARRRSRLQ